MLINKSDFIEKQKIARRAEILILLVYLGLMFGGIILAGAFVRASPNERSNSIWFPLATVGIVIILSVLAIWFSRFKAKRFGLACPSCSKPLIGLHAQIAIASNNCCHCGGRVFKDAS